MTQQIKEKQMEKSTGNEKGGASSLEDLKLETKAS